MFGLKKRNQSKSYSIKLNQLFNEAIGLLAEYPKIGKQTDFHGVRAKVVRDYYIFYADSESEIYILAIGDIRQDPITRDEQLK